LTKGILRITLLEDAIMLNSKRDNEAHFLVGGHRGKAVARGPGGGLKVTKNHNTDFHALGETVGILFDA
jgi:hypothetical protein